MAKPRSRRDEERQKASAAGWLKIGIVVVLVLAVAGYAVYVSGNKKTLEETTLCPTDVRSVTVLLVDLTDPLNLPQRQDFLNQLERLRAKIPRYGKLSIYKVSSGADSLLLPVITRCNPGTAADVSDIDSSPEKLQRQWETQFKAPLDQAFQTLMKAAPSTNSPILESIQSVALTELQAPGVDGKPRTLIVASDLLQNTGAISFYQKLPAPDVLIKSQAFQSVRTNLAGVDVELWMLQRPLAVETAPLPLAELWERMLTEMGAVVNRIYNVSG